MSSTKSKKRTSSSKLSLLIVPNKWMSRIDKKTVRLLISSQSIKKLFKRCTAVWKKWLSDLMTVRRIDKQDCVKPAKKWKSSSTGSLRWTSNCTKAASSFKRSSYLRLKSPNILRRPTRILNLKGSDKVVTSSSWYKSIKGSCNWSRIWSSVWGLLKLIKLLLKRAIC